MQRRRIFVLAARTARVVARLVLCLLVVAPAAAAPDPDLWARWQKHGFNYGGAKINNDLYTFFLKNYHHEEDGVARIRYWQVTPHHRVFLDDYVKMLAQTEVDALSREEQLAFWINTYNAVTIWVVLKNYPVESIRDIKSGIFTPGPWEKPLITIMGEELTLNDIEHRILRPIWQDARIHYAVNCASIGCPNIATVPYSAEKINYMLNDAARKFINHPRGVRVDAETDELVVSSIYDWFEQDFAPGFSGDESAVLAHIRKYANPALLKKLAGRTTIDRYEYDWRINE